MKKQGLDRVTSDTGLWAAVPSALPESRSGLAPVIGSGAGAGPESEPAQVESFTGAPISWLPRPKLWRRVVRNINLPAAVGITAFVIALTVTAWIMVQGMVGESNEALGETLDEPIGLVAGMEPGDLLVSPDPSIPGQVGVAIVHVVGEVAHPGVVEVAADSRVIDAIQAAGGATDQAVLTAINLARTVSDGEQIVVPNAELAQNIAASAGSPDVRGSGSAEAATGASNGGLVNLNTASADELTTLPKIGPSIAQRIVDWREANGGFGSIDQLLEVNGIGAKTLEGLRDRVGV